MPSSKGKPTDPKLREKVKEDVKNETNKDGGGKGQWSAWKAAKLSKEYEKKGGSYENSPGSKNEPKKGAPQPKSSGKKKVEEKQAPNEEEKSESPSANNDSEEKENKKPKANTSAKKSKPAAVEKKTAGRGKTGVAGAAKKEKPKAEGSRKSSRLAGKRGVEADDAGARKKAKK
ncbi:hypothetical protein BU26DRAFT_599821 [Trematosphaeria pertusa]|uniref:Hypervirulence associated protein TUDOR domain-containing protein n=1 Tax=Trematosphaeria pertusa TaxID=390896 RepID=A0A6A6J4Z4_9PLEO|nr:uncharacterized protein BU26DRAFT_599821 [Trematosphaeria pertusa]KAF2257302.1 hypothetical protein BU26DRAFT_599821 [Trematosphaeria pertusa]